MRENSNGQHGHESTIDPREAADSATFLRIPTEQELDELKDWLRLLREKELANREITQAWEKLRAPRSHHP